MAEVRISIGGRGFDVACQDGEENYLRAAAALLDAEATTLVDQVGRLPEARMLLMAGLMLADKTAGMEEEMRGKTAELDRLKSQPKAEAERVEVPVIPTEVSETLAELAARAEAMADALEEAG
ncbi:MAG: cell division protein ZapA [Paracoccaceae bacterium]|nr:cell division protein ZapA [Paracoccaceae bacterium]